ncbi:MAG: glycosyltransferase family 2 protein [Alloacidobacterium sp.]
MMLISVAMCTYNGDRFLKEQLESINAQTLLPEELVICDDGSSDDTPSILQKFVESAPFQVRIFRNGQNIGSTKNFQRAIERCQGELIALCDQDDVWEPQKLRTLHDQLTRSGAGGVFSDAELIDDNSQLIGRRLLQSIDFTANEQQRWLDDDCLGNLLKKDVVTGATMLFRSDLRSALLPVPDGWIHDAWFAWMLILHSKLVLASEPFIRYRVHAEQQLGVPATAPDFQQKLERAKQTGTQQYLERAAQLAAVLRHLESCPSIRCTQAIPAVRGKIEQCCFRADLRALGRRRVWEIFSRYREYFVYSEGIRSMAKDLLSRNGP